MFGRRTNRRAFGLGIYFSDTCSRFFTMGLDSPAAMRLLLAMSLLSLIFLAVPGIYIFLLFTGVGIPLIPFTFLLPPIVFIWCFVLLFRRMLPSVGRYRTIVACIATGFLLFLPAQWMNFPVYLSSAKAVAEDHNSTVLPLKSETLAIVNRGSYTDVSCVRLCLHALLNGTASTVIVHTAPIDTAEPAAEELGTAYYFARHDVCPDVKLEPRHYALRPQGMPSINGYVLPRQRNAAEIGAQRIASGNCLLSRKARINEADLIVALGPIEKQDKGKDAFWFKLSGTEFARLNVYKASGSNTFEEVFRETSGKSMRFFPFLLPMASWVQGEPSGWLRTEVVLNTRDYSKPQGWDAFDVLEDTMGLKLTLDGSTYRKDAQDGIIAVLDAMRAPNPAEWQAFILYWNELNFLGTGVNPARPNPKDAEIALRIAHSPNMPLPRGFDDFVRYAIMTKLLPANDLGKAFAARLRADGTKEDTRQSALGMANLPEEVLQDHQDLLVDLARTPEKWSLVGRLLQYLYLSGPDAGPILRDLVLAGVNQDNLTLARQGLTGLCKIGPQARPFVESLDETRIAMGRRDAKRYFSKRIALSAALRIEPEKVRRAIPRSVIQSQKPGWFEKNYKSGTSRQWHCFR